MYTLFYPEGRSSRELQNVADDLPDYTASNPKRLINT
jgi:hypothetical protein